MQRFIARCELPDINDLGDWQQAPSMNNPPPGSGDKSADCFERGTYPDPYYTIIFSFLFNYLLRG